MAGGASLSRWTSLRDALANRDLRRLLFAVASWTGTEAAFLLAASILALDLGGPAAVGVVGALRVLPAAVGASLISGVADRVSRVAIVTGVNAAFVGVSLAMAVTIWSNAPLAVVYLVVGVGSVVSALLKPGMQAILPQLVRTPAQLLTAQTGWSIANGLGAVAGPAAAALLLSLFGIDAVFIALAGAHALTALVARAIHTEFQPPRIVLAERTDRWLAPLHGVALFARPGARTAFTLLMLGRLLSGFLSVAIILQATELLGSGEAAQVLAGTLMTAFGIGGFIGSTLAFGALAHHGSWWFGVGTIAYGLGVAVIGLVDGATWSAVLLAAAGAGNAMWWTFGADLVSRLLPDHVAGRGWGAVHGIGAGAYALGAMLAPPLAGQLGLDRALLVVGLVLVVVPLLSWHGLGVLTDLTTPAAVDLELLDAVPVLSALPGVTVARIACAVEPRVLAAGTTVVREGEPGDEFFVVRSGDLIVYQGEQEVRRLGPGDSFGEIALLRSVPRTATVVAVTDVELVCVGHELFVASVTGHRSSDAGASARVSALLDEDRRRSQPDPY